MILEQILAYLK